MDAAVSECPSATLYQGPTRFGGLPRTASTGPPIAQGASMRIRDAYSRRAVCRRATPRHASHDVRPPRLHSPTLRLQGGPVYVLSPNAEKQDHDELQHRFGEQAEHRFDTGRRRPRVPKRPLQERTPASRRRRTVVAHPRCRCGGVTAPANREATPITGVRSLRRRLSVPSDRRRSPELPSCTRRFTSPALRTESR